MTKKLFVVGVAAAALLASCGGSTSTTSSAASSIATSTATTSETTSTATSSSEASSSSAATSSSNEDSRPDKPDGSSSTSEATSEASSESSEEASSSASEASSSEATSTSTIDNISSGSASVSFVYGNQTTTKTISAAYLIDGVDVTITSGTYASASSSADQVVFLVINGGSLTITGTSSSYVSITKSGSAASNGQVGDDYNFYGINSGIVVSGSGSSATISYANISTTSNGSNAVVATNGGSVNITNSTITTSGSAGSRGLHTTYDGAITADNVSISTQGASCASLANDRGGGTINASNMTLETNSNGSPLVYSTDYIKVTDSTGTANSAQAVVVEGGSSAYLDGCNFTCSGDGNRSGTSDSSSSSHVIDAGGVFIYQSVSGDSEEGTDYFHAYDTTIKVTTSGVPMFYLTNITAEITLDGNTFTQASSSDYFLMAEATDQWGTSGSNGATVTVTADFAQSTVSTYVGSTSSISWTVS
ncbi:MAG: hypothetical protein K6B65_00915 [Bacilli bacterium]|nr:hypothetical protein [Bacilli bacterium]